MSFIDILLCVVLVLGLIFIGLYFLNRWAMKKYANQQDLIEKSKMTTNIFVINKKKMYLKDANLPKALSDSVPKIYRFMKLPMVQAKIGNKIMNLVCDKKVFKEIELKKNHKVEMTGIYIIGLCGKSNKSKSK